MKVLLVGGSGHVSKLIIPYLMKQHELRVLDLAPPGIEGVEFVQGSAMDPEVLKRSLEGVDAFVWLAMRNGQGGMSTNQDIETIINNYDLNTKALHLFLYLAQEAGVKRGVYTTSMSVHYRGRDFYPAEETVPLDSPSVYGMTKGLGEQICAYFSHWFGMDILGLRISGPRNRADFLAQRRNPQRAGDGSFVHPLDEEDMANAYLGALAALGDEPRYESIYIVGDENGVEHDLSKAARLIGWRPQSQRLLD